MDHYNDRDRKLKNKVAVITGGSSGLGLAAAKLFAEQGAKVAITGRDKTNLEIALKVIGHHSIGFISDAAVVANAVGLYDEVLKSFGKIDVLVVNAAVYLTAPLTEYTEEMFDNTNAVNFRGVFFAVKSALPYLNDGASIILTASTTASKGYASGAVFAATKAAVRSLAASFSAELANRKIRVNVISPGPSDTPVFARRGGTADQVLAAKARLAEMTILKRLVLPEEIAHSFLYLASQDSVYMVGSELLIDGGFRLL